MTPWPDLLAAALVGTDRRSGPADGDTAAEVLDEAAAWSVYRRAGLRPEHGVDRPPAAPTESREVVVPAAAARLAVLIEAGSAQIEPAVRTALLAEWLRLVAAHDRVLPPESLPDLLDLGRYQSALRPLIVAAGGARVGWLARQNPDWNYLVAAATAAQEASGESVDDGRAQWRQASPERRVALLRANRRSDPAGSRGLLEQEWPRLGPDERVGLIAVLDRGLADDDEDFLERALDDRRAQVRAIATALLARLPNSALNRRMVARARACLRVENGRIAVTPPDEFDDSMRRDGLAARPPNGVGERTWWLEEILAHTPLAALTSLEPGQYLALSIEDDWAPVVHRGLARAAASQQQPVWAAALLEARAGSGRSDLAELLYPALSLDERARRAIEAIENGPADGGITLLAKCPAPWSTELSAVALRALEHPQGYTAPSGKAGPGEIAASRRLMRELERLCVHAALSLPPSFAAEAAGAVQRITQADRPEAQIEALTRLAAILGFRHQMSMEIA